MKKLLSTVLAGAMALALAAPVFAETYELGVFFAPLRDDHGELLPVHLGSDHENSGDLDGSPAKLWPDTTYYFAFFPRPGLPDAGKLLTDSRLFRFSYNKEGGGKKIVKELDALSKGNPGHTDSGEARYYMIKLVTGPNTTDEEFLFRLTGKFTVKDGANLEALADLGEYLGAELEHGDVIEIDLGRFVVGNRKTASGDVDRDAGEYAMTWDPRDADRNTLLYETEAGTLLEVRLKADTDADMLYLKLNTAWKALEEAGLVPEEAFPDGDAVLYSFEDTGNRLSATSRADIYIHNHPDTALGGEAMTDLFEDGKLYLYSALVSEDGKVSLTDIRGKASIGIADGEKALRIRDRALTNVILSTAPYHPQ